MMRYGSRSCGLEDLSMLLNTRGADSFGEWLGVYSIR